MELLASLLILLALAKLVGELFERLGHGEMLGEILVGIFLGGSVLAFFHPTLELKVLADIGVFFLVMVAGLELSTRDIGDALRGRRIGVSLASFAIPLVAGYALGHALGLGFTTSLILAVCISITALPISVRILVDMGLLKTEVGKSIVGAAVVNDILGIAALAVVLNFAAAGPSPAPDPAFLGFLVVKIVVFVLLVWAADRAIFHFNRIDSRLLPDRVQRALERVRSKEALFSLAIIAVLSFAALAELVGLHFIIGAFFGSLLICRELIGEEKFGSVTRTASSVALGVFAPVFFVYLGLLFDLSALAAPALVVSVLVVALVSKFAGGAIGGLIAGLKARTSIAIGAGVNGRGIMELVIAAIALERGLIAPDLFSVLVFMGLVTTVLTPPMLRLARAGQRSQAVGRPPSAATVRTADLAPQAGG